MIKIYNNLKINNFGEIKTLINETAKGNKVLVIKQLLKSFSTLKNFQNFIKDELSYSLDRRHYDFLSNSSLSDWWTIKYDPERDTSYTYSKTKQPLHTDNAWFSNPSQMNFFYMDKQAINGGENMFYSLDRLIQDLYADEPQLLDDLQNIEVVISKGNDEVFNKTTIIKNKKIYWNFYRTNKADKEIKNMCNYFFKYLHKKELSKSVEVYRSETDDAFCFNDLTLLHGRLSYEAKNKNDRVLHQSMWNIE